MSDQKQLANEASIVLSSPAFNDAFMAVRAKYLESMLKTEYDQPEMREECWRKLKVLDEVQKQLVRTMQTGKLL